mgnify:CR=1 FL=1
MKREYTVLESGYIQYEENGFLYTIPNDEANSDYQAYLNPVEHLTEIPPQAALSTPMVIDDPKS